MQGLQGTSSSFYSTSVLARILEGTEQPGSLAQALDPRTPCRDVACYVSTLGKAFKSLPTTQQEQIRNRWGSHFNEILSLSRETDAELFYEALFHLGQRLERAGHTEQAALVYSVIATPPHPLSLSPWGEGKASSKTAAIVFPSPLGERGRGEGVSAGQAVPSHLQQRAQERIAVLNGGGSMGQQMEHMGRGFARSALDPGLLLGASSMGLFGKGVELIGMRYLAGANFFRRSYGLARTALELAPKATGFALEATAFPFAINGANELLGRPVSWAHMDHRIYGSWFFLGGMRIGGRFGASASLRLGVPGLQPLGSIAGVGLGHGGEVLAGLKEWHGFSNFAVETFGTWANLQVAGRFSEYVFEGQISRMQRVMDLSIEGGKRGRGEEGKRRGFGEWVDSISEAFNNLSGPTPLAATAAAGYFPSPSRRLFPSSPRSPRFQDTSFKMTGESRGSRPPSERPPSGNKLLARNLSVNLAKQWGTKPDDPTLTRIVDNFAATPFPQEAAKYSQVYLRFLLKEAEANLETEFGPLLKGPEWWPETLAHATELFRHIMELDSFRRGTGSIHDHLLQQAFENTLQKESLPGFHQLLAVALFDRGIPSVENFLRNHFPPANFELTQDHRNLPPSYSRRLEKLYLPPPVVKSVLAYLSSLAGFRPTTAEPVLQALEGFLHREGFNNDTMDTFFQAVQRAQASEVPLLYLDRIFKVLMRGDRFEKIVEIAANERFSFPELYNIVDNREVMKKNEEGKLIDGTIYTGYIRDRELAEKFALLYRRARYYVHSQTEAQRRGNRLETCEKILKRKEKRGEPLEFEELDYLEMLATEATPLAALAREAIRNDDVGLVVGNREQIQELWLWAKHSRRNEPAPHAFYLPEHLRRTGQPLIAVTNLDPKLTRLEKKHQAIQVTSAIVHEFQHHVDYRKLNFSDPDALFLTEMRAKVEQLTYKVFQGALTEWRMALRLTPDGPGIYIRNQTDKSLHQEAPDVLLER